MEDIKSLCNRCVVINGGKKLYDGDTVALFEKYQTHKKVTISFEHETHFTQDNIEMIESSPYRTSFMIEKEKLQPLLQSILSSYALSDFTIEEDDIGNIVERIYQTEMQVK
jgi:ABC-2 type transport system ATP-binding protein